MSRCYPYPPPGYEKKAHVELGLSPKKEKHKHKDKKKKRRKDSETNGDPLPRDKDKLSKKVQQTGPVNEGLSLANGRFPETKATSSVAVYENAIQRLQADNSSRDEVLLDGVLAINSKGLEPHTKEDSQIPLISVRAAGSSNGAAANDTAPSTRTSSKIEDELSRLRHTQFMPHVEKVWSAVDDQEWLFLCDNQLQSGPKRKLEEGETPQVWAEAVLLPSVGIYALPYLVPD